MIQCIKWWAKVVVNHLNQYGFFVSFTLSKQGLYSIDSFEDQVENDVKQLKPWRDQRLVLNDKDWFIKEKMTTVEILNKASGSKDQKVLSACFIPSICYEWIDSEAKDEVGSVWWWLLKRRKDLFMIVIIFRSFFTFKGYFFIQQNI